MHAAAGRLALAVTLALTASGCRDRGGDDGDDDGGPADADPAFPYPPPAADLVPAIGGAATLEIATWNLENFPAEDLTPSLAADLITSLDLDVVVVEEIANVAAWNELITRLREHDGVLSTDQYTATSYQKIGVIYRAAEVTVAPFELLFDADDYAFPRPALSVVVTVGGVELELIGVHLKAGVGTEDADRRRLAIAALEARLRAQVDGGGEPEVVLLGDYNQVVTGAEGMDVLSPLLAAPERYTIRSQQLASAGGVTYLGFGGKFIDHITTTAALDAAWGDATLVVPRLDQMLTNYRNLVSDHLPVVLVAPQP